MSSQARIVVQPSERVAVVGRTGSGKTWLTRPAMRRYQNVIVFDEKGTYPAIGPRFDSVDRLIRAANKEPRGRYIYTPSEHEMYDLDLYDELWAWIYKRQNTVLLIDEAYAVVKGRNDLTKNLKALYTRGREKNIGVWANMQRPVMVPNFFLTEAEHFFVFQTTHPDDLKKVSGFVGEAVMEPLARFHFHYFNIITGEHRTAKQ